MASPTHGPTGRVAIDADAEREIRRRARLLIKEHGSAGASRASGLPRQMLASLAAGIAVRHGSLLAASVALGVPLAAASLPVALATPISYT